MKKTILVTGGAGFIGSHLIERLLRNGHQVVCVDNFYTGSEKNINSFLENENFKLLKKDIVEPLKIEDHIDEIYNLACPASPVHYQQDPVKTITTNVVGMKNMLDLALSHEAKILQASTSEVYGDPLEHPQRETYWGNVNPIGIRACYDEGKRAAETLCFDYHREKGVDIRVIRIFNTYGPRMAENDGRVVSNFIVQALKGDDITIYGSGSHTRSFQYVTDLIEGMVRVMDCSNTGPINLGNPQEYTIKELAEKIILLTGSASNIIYKPIPIDDPKKRKPDISKAKELIGWEPHISLDEGLPYVIEYFKSLS